jgi:hypothetical protein
MVKLGVVDRPNPNGISKPIGVIKSVAAGFDKIAAQPLLLIPPILLDLFLWFGPRLTIPTIFEELSKFIIAPTGMEEAIVEQIRSSFIELGARVNLFSVMSSFPLGISTLMAGRRPITSPVGDGSVIQLTNPLVMFMSLVVILAIGQGIGAQFHRWIARQTAPGEEQIDQWKASVKAILLAVVVFSLAFLILFGFSLVAVLASLLLPLFGFMVAFLGFSFILWAFIYLIFTPHGIILNRLGIVRAMMESTTLVRWNILPVVGYLGLAYGITYLTNLVWVLPDEGSWFSILAVVGHAFVSATLLAGSYAFYQDRRSWLFSLRGSEVKSGIEG